MAFSKFHFFLIPVFSSVVLCCIDLKPSPCPAPSSHPCGFALLGPLFLNSTWLTSMWLNTCLCTPRIGPTPVLCFSSRHLTYHREPQWVSFPQGWVCLALYLIRHVLHAFFFFIFLLPVDMFLYLSKVGIGGVSTISSQLQPKTGQKRTQNLFIFLPPAMSMMPTLWRCLTIQKVSGGCGVWHSGSGLSGKGCALLTIQWQVSWTGSSLCRTGIFQPVLKSDLLPTSMENFTGCWESLFKGLQFRK